MKNETMMSFLKVIIVGSLIVNTITIVLSVLMNIGFTIISDFAGIMIIIAWCVNITVIFFTFANLNRNNSAGKKLKVLCYVFMVFFFFATVLIYFKPIIFALEMDLTSIRYIIALLIHQIVYYGILGFGLVLAYADLKYFNRPETWVAT